MVERAAMYIQGQARPLKLALESRVGGRFDEHLDFARGMIRCAAILRNIGKRGTGGRSAWGRVGGSGFNLETSEFGGRVMYLWPNRVGKGKLVSQWGGVVGITKYNAS